MRWISASGLVCGLEDGGAPPMLRGRPQDGLLLGIQDGVLGEGVVACNAGRLRSWRCLPKAWGLERTTPDSPARRGVQSEAERAPPRQIERSLSPDVERSANLRELHKGLAKESSFWVKLLKNWTHSSSVQPGLSPFVMASVLRRSQMLPMQASRASLLTWPWNPPKMLGKVSLSGTCPPAERVTK